MYVRGEMIAVNIKYIHIFYDILHTATRFDYLKKQISGIVNT